MQLQKGKIVQRDATHQHTTKHDHHVVNNDGVHAMAVSATLHCLTGCAIGEVLGLVIGTAYGLSTGLTILLAVALAFVFGFALSAWPLVKAGIGFTAAISLVAAADTLSIATMELVDNLVMVAIPGALHAGLVSPLFWISMPLALTAAFFAALPVNKYLLKRNKGHAITMNALGGHEHHQDNN
ncbi:MAG TPA: DUF4396 domain-containing protein [Candidatus Saccharimonadales bacterium]|jgi:hypothetical protein